MIELRKSGRELWASLIDPPSLSPQQLVNAYAGTYYSEALGTAYNVGVENDRLVIRHPRYSDRPLQPADEDEFVGGVGIVRFFRNDHGLVESLALLDEDRTLSRWSSGECNSRGGSVQLEQAPV
jgi:hypothetical protein